MTSGAAMAVPSADARARLLAELAAGPARRGYAIAYDLLRNRAEAEEAVQEALALACERIHELRDPAAAPAWLLRIVTTVCLRVLRRRRLRHALFGRFGVGSARDRSPDDDHTPTRPLLHSDAPVPAPEQLAARQARAALLHHLDGLPTQQRAALVLRYGQDLSVDDVATLLGIEPATAKTHLVRGLARLRERMEGRA